MVKPYCAVNLCPSALITTHNSTVKGKSTHTSSNSPNSALIPDSEVGAGSAGHQPGNITDFACAVALGYGIGQTATMGKALWRSGLWSIPPRGCGIRVNIPDSVLVAAIARLNVDRLLNLPTRDGSPKKMLRELLR